MIIGDNPLVLPPRHLCLSNDAGWCEAYWCIPCALLPQALSPNRLPKPGRITDFAMAVGDADRNYNHFQAVLPFVKPGDKGITICY